VGICPASLGGVGFFDVKGMMRVFMILFLSCAGGVNNLRGCCVVVDWKSRMSQAEAF